MLVDILSCIEEFFKHGFSTLLLMKFAFRQTIGPQRKTLEPPLGAGGTQTSQRVDGVFRKFRKKALKALLNDFISPSPLLFPSRLIKLRWGVKLGWVYRLPSATKHLFGVFALRLFLWNHPPKPYSLPIQHLKDTCGSGARAAVFPRSGWVYEEHNI